MKELLYKIMLKAKFNVLNNRDEYSSWSKSFGLTSIHYGAAFEAGERAENNRLRPIIEAQNEVIAELVEALDFYRDRNNWERIEGNTKWASNLKVQDCAMLNCAGGRARLAITKAEKRLKDLINES